MKISSKLSKYIQIYTPLWAALSQKRQHQLLALQLLSIMSAIGEVTNLGALLPFLRILGNPQEGLNALGPLAVYLKILPTQHLLLFLGLAFIAVVVLSTVVRVFTINVQLRLSALITTDFGDKVFSNILMRPYEWHLRNNTSSIITYLTRDVDGLFASVQGFMLLGMNLLILLLLGGSMISLAPGVMVATMLLLSAFYAIVFRFTRGTVSADGERMLRGYQGVVQVAQEALGGIRDVLLDRSQLTFLRAYRINNLDVKLASAAINSKAQVPRYLIEGFTMVLIVGISLSLALAGQGIERQLPLLGTLALGAYRLLQPLQQCFSAFNGLKANQPSIRRLSPFLGQGNRSLPRLAEQMPSAQSKYPTMPPVGTGLVELQDVSFRYTDDGPWILRGLNLVIRPGERLAFVGTTGSGKSTTSDLILGLLAPTEGRILVNGQDLHDNHGMVKAWQSRVAHVPQQIYLSDASFASNIAFGVPEERINQRRVRQAAEQARIAELIESKDQGYGTLVGERGVQLSGGQRQRIGIARALYKQAQLLVFDEATSALDNQTEAEVMAGIEALDRKITVILIAHRLSTVERCDRVVLLEHGQIKGAGSFEELLESHMDFMRLPRASC